MSNFVARDMISPSEGMRRHIPKEKIMSKSKKNGSKPAVKGTEKVAPEKPVERFVVGDLSKVKRGFLLEFVTFAKKEGKVDVETLIGEFNGRTIDGKKIDANRVRRYLSYCRVHKILAPVSK
jgi:hypothetical protein